MTSTRRSPITISPAARELISAYRASNGVTPELLEALSWMARGELAARNLDQAEQVCA